VGSEGCPSPEAGAGASDGGAAAVIEGMRESEIVESGSWSSKVGEDVWIWRKREEGEVGAGRWMA